MGGDTCRYILSFLSCFCHSLFLFLLLISAGDKCDEPKLISLPVSNTTYIMKLNEQNTMARIRRLLTLTQVLTPRPEIYTSQITYA